MFVCVCLCAAVCVALCVAVFSPAVEKALYEAVEQVGGVPPDPHGVRGHPKHIGWARASRTDRGVHAVRNVVSFKVRPACPRMARVGDVVTCVLLCACVPVAAAVAVAVYARLCVAVLLCACAWRCRCRCRCLCVAVRGCVAASLRVYVCLLYVCRCVC